MKIDIMQNKILTSTDDKVANYRESAIVFQSLDSV